MTYGESLCRALKSKYFNSCYQKLAHQDSITAIEHANDLSRKHPDRQYSIYVCNFCACLHVGHGRTTLPEEPIYEGEDNE